jgi:hypothetical protein
MPLRPKPGLRRQLMEARKDVQRVINALKGPYPEKATRRLSLGAAAIGNKQLLARLREALREIDDNLAGLGPDDA